MDNIQFEISHERVIAIIAKHIDVLSDQLSLHIQGELGDGSASVSAHVRTDLRTANKIDRKLRRLGVDDDQDSDSPAPQVRHG